MPSISPFVSKLLASSALALGAFLLSILALIAASLFAPINLLMSLALGLAAAFLIIGIVRLWRQSDGWRFALGAGVAALSLWVVLEYGAPYFSPSVRMPSIGAP